MSLIEKAVEHLEGMIPQTGKTDTSGVRKDGNAALPVSAPLRVGDSNKVSTAQSSPVTSKQVTINLDGLRAGGFVVPETPDSQIAEEFRVIKRPLLTNVSGRSAAPIRNPNLIMVTSALPGEGKSFTAVNLAISIAMELDRTVLLVDADVARPSLPRLLGLPEQKGLLDVLQDRTLNLGDVLLRSNVDKLTILTAGTRDAHATELLASEAMGRLMSELARRYSDRIIVFDSPPLLLTTEARELATRMGQIVFVVQAEQTPQAAVKEALSTIESCSVKLMVLNQARNVESVAYGYEYGYGY